MRSNLSILKKINLHYIFMMYCIKEIIIIFKKCKIFVSTHLLVDFFKYCYNSTLINFVIINYLNPPLYSYSLAHAFSFCFKTYFSSKILEKLIRKTILHICNFCFYLSFDYSWNLKKKCKIISFYIMCGKLKETYKWSKHHRFYFNYILILFLL